MFIANFHFLFSLHNFNIWKFVLIAIFTLHFFICFFIIGGTVPYLVIADQLLSHCSYLFEICIVANCWLIFSQTLFCIIFMRFDFYKLFFFIMLSETCSRILLVLPKLASILRKLQCFFLNGSNLLILFDKIPSNIFSKNGC